MLAADCANVGLFCKAICCSSSRGIVFCSEGGVCASANSTLRAEDDHPRRTATDGLTKQSDVRAVGRQHPSGGRQEEAGGSLPQSASRLTVSTRRQRSALRRAR